MIQFEKRILRCAALDLTRDEALENLKSSSTHFPEGADISAIVKEGNEYVATIYVPASRPFPPNDDNAEDNSAPEPKAEGGDSESKSPEESGPPSEAGDGPKPPKPDGESKESPSESKGKEGGDDVLNLLHEIFNLLKAQAAPGPGAGAPPMGAPPMSPHPAGPPIPPGPPAPGGPPAPPHGGGPQEIIHRRGLKPGEAPPGVAPIGSPSFASAKGRMPLDKVAHIQAVAPKSNISVAQAHSDLTKKYLPLGFRVAQISETPDGQNYAALLVRV